MNPQDPTTGAAPKKGKKALKKGKTAPQEGTRTRRAPAWLAKMRPGPDNPLRQVRMGVSGWLSVSTGAVLALFFGSMFVPWGILTGSSQAFAAGDSQKTIERADQFEDISPTERHKPPFNRGTTAAVDGDYDTAESELRVALERTPEADECAVRLNLAWVVEQKAGIARADDDIDTANERYDEAQTLLAEAPESCRPENSPQQQANENAQERTENAQEEMNQEGSGEGSEGEGEGSEGENEGESGSEGENGGSGDSGNSGGSGDEDEGSGGGSEDEENQAPKDPLEGGEVPDDPEEKKRILRERSEKGQERQDQQDQAEDGSSGYDKPW
ncbi:hypothetical protein [Brevibacterium litoralis]|uniref:hypothetical protein n=1 Tax=Brevibacterium litoralis TaxID=3138935 RepID=UPI0032EEB96B